MRQIYHPTELPAIHCYQKSKNEQNIIVTAQSFHKHSKMQLFHHTDYLSTTALMADAFCMVLASP
jgi:hypothetical protein